MPDMTGTMMGGGMMGWMMGWMMALVIVVPLLIIAAVALAVGWAVRSGRTAEAQAMEPPLTILQRRYVRGDIGTDEYERMRAALAKD